jgi:hypothetical protein
LKLLCQHEQSCLIVLYRCAIFVFLLTALWK